MDVNEHTATFNRMLAALAHPLDVSRVTERGCDLVEGIARGHEYHEATAAAPVDVLQAQLPALKRDAMGSEPPRARSERTIDNLCANMKQSRQNRAGRRRKENQQTSRTTKRSQNPEPRTLQ